MNKYLSEALEKYIAYVKNNVDYGILETIQIARTNTTLINTTDSKIEKRLEPKHLTYEHINDYIYMLVKSDFLSAGERLGKVEMRELRYNLYTIKEMAKEFGNTIDVFYNGLKIPYNQIRCALFDDYFIVELPSKYKDYSSMNVLMHGYTFTEIYDNNVITIPKFKINDPEFSNENFFVFVDNKQTINFSVTDDNDHYTIRISDIGETYEISYYRYLNYYGKTSIKNDHINIMDIKRKYPIAAHNIITFSNGLLVNLELEAKTDGIFKALSPIDDEMDLYYTYKDYSYEDNYYNDQYRWLATRMDDFMNRINNPDLLPDFANEFKLFRNDISLQDFLKNHYRNNDKYNSDKTIDTIGYCEECLITLGKYIFEEYKDKFITKSISVYLSELDYDAQLRKDNKKEILNEKFQNTFSESLFLLYFENKENYRFSVYIDGIRTKDYGLVYNERGVTYLYIDTRILTKESFILIELYRTNNTSFKEITVASDGTNKIILENISTLDVFNSIEDYKYISIAKQLEDGRFINDGKNISSIEMDESGDKIIINLLNSYDVDILIRIYNNCFYKEYEFNTRTESDEGYTFNLTDFEACLEDKDNFRVYKNGKEIPKEYYSIEFPTEDNDLTTPIMKMNLKYYIYELITVEFNADKYREVYFKEKLKTDGKVDILHPPNIEDKFISEVLNYYNLNGRRIDKKHYKYWCSKGISLFNYKTTHYFSLVLITNREFDEMLKEFIEAYKVNKKLLDEYILGLMLGELTDENDPPLKEDEDPCTDPDPTRSGKLYYDLYREFLRLNIINDEAKIPDYIILKYGALINDDNILKIDADQKQLYWMPLNANKFVDYDSGTRKIMDLYYQLLDDQEALYVLNANEIPDDVYEKYKELFDNGCLVLQVPKQ